MELLNCSHFFNNSKSPSPATPNNATGGINANPCFNESKIDCDVPGVVVPGGFGISPGNPEPPVAPPDPPPVEPNLNTFALNSFTALSKVSFAIAPVPTFMGPINPVVGTVEIPPVTLNVGIAN